MSALYRRLPDHGTVTRYRNYKCRCLMCRAAHREATARNRADRLASGRLSHGTRSAYDAGCRCVDCTRVHKEAHRAYRRSLGLNTTPFPDTG